MSAQNDYWKECISIASEECDLKMTPEQLTYLAEQLMNARATQTVDVPR